MFNRKEMIVKRTAMLYISVDRGRFLGKTRETEVLLLEVKLTP